MTQEDFAARLMISRNYVSLLEGGKKTPSPKLEFQMRQLAKGAAALPSEDSEHTVNEPPANFGVRNNPPLSGKDASDPSLKLNTAFRPTPGEPTAEDCLSYFARYLSDVRLVPGGVGHTWIQLQRTFPLDEAKRLREAHETTHG